MCIVATGMHINKSVKNRHVLRLDAVLSTRGWHPLLSVLLSSVLSDMDMVSFGIISFSQECPRGSADEPIYFKYKHSVSVIPMKHFSLFGWECHTPCPHPLISHLSPRDEEESSSLTISGTVRFWQKWLIIHWHNLIFILLTYSRFKSVYIQCFLSHRINTIVTIVTELFKHDHMCILNVDDVIFTHL